jgi:methylphosphotriester-DNA--protein-cysteine methyltransferase
MVVSVSASRPAPLGEDSRGILHPAVLQRLVRLTRFPPGPGLAGLVDRFWAVEWELLPGTAHTQQVLTHPGSNLSVSHADARPGPGAAGRVEARLNGVARSLTTRQLAGRGWAVAAMTTPGGLGAFVGRPASDFAGRVVPLGPLLSLDEAGLVEEVRAQPDAQARAGVLKRALNGVLAAADPQRVSRARQVAEVAKIAETDRSVRQLRHLCDRAGLGARTLQRMFLQHAGVPPTWVLRRYRLLDAAEAVREGQPVEWAALAADLGYADQAHLIRDFRAAIGQTPAAYARSQGILAAVREGPGQAP